MELSIQNNQINFYGKTLYPLIPKKELEEMLKRGYAYERIGRLYKMPQYAVARCVRTHGLSSSHVIPVEEKVGYIRFMREQGYSDEYIKKKLRASDKHFEKLKQAEKDSRGLLVNILEKLNIKYEDVAKDLK